VGSRAQIAGRAQVWGDVPEGAIVSGVPARAHRDTLRVQASVKRLPNLFERVEALERRVSDLPGEH